MVALFAAVSMETETRFWGTGLPDMLCDLPGLFNLGLWTVISLLSGPLTMNWMDWERI